MGKTAPCGQTFRQIYPAQPTTIMRSIYTRLTGTWNPRQGAARLRPYALAVLSLLLAPIAVTAAAEDDWSEAERIVRSIERTEFPNRVFDVRAHGAKPDDAIDDRPAILAAIRACHVAGGGRVLLPAGVLLSNGPLHLQSHVELHLEQGSTLRFSARPEDFLPVVLTRWEGTECFNYSPFIYARNVSNVAITGTGTIDGNSGRTFAQWKPQQGPDQLRIREMGAAGVPLPERVFGAGHWLRPGLIQFFACNRVLVEGVTILDAPFWVIHPVFCRDVIVRGVTVDSRNPNNDGVDPESSINVLIEDCTFRTGDDSVAIKSGRDQDAWQAGVPTENIVVRRCVMDSKANGLCIGSEMSGGVRNVFLEDCEVGEVMAALCFKSNLDRGGEVSHVRVRNIQVRKATRNLLEFTTAYHGYRGGNFPPVFRDFRISDLTCAQVDGTAIFAVGTGAAPIENVTVRDVTVDQAVKASKIEHVREFRLEGVTIAGKPLTGP